MSLDLEFSEEQAAIAQAVTRFCEQHCEESKLMPAAELPLSLWRKLAQMGVFAVVLPDQEGGAVAACAIMEVLGEQNFPGPLAETYLAARLLQGSLLEKLIEGRQLISVGDGVLMPWAAQADIFIVADSDQLFLSEAIGDAESLEVLGGELWGKFAVDQLRPITKFDNVEHSIALMEIALSAYLCAAAQRLVREASEYVQNRRQFKRNIGDFQAVAHPLADCLTRLTASITLARAAACKFDLQDNAGAVQLAAAAGLSATTAALDSIHVCHQVYGAVGVTLEGPAYNITRRIRQLASQMPNAAAARDTLLESIGMRCVGSDV
jgi:alkylation response protein AidB-like acyl-CoA dehydrogenase